MGNRIPSTRSMNQAVHRYIGSDMDVVRHVAENMDAVQEVSDLIGNPGATSMLNHDYFVREAEALGYVYIGNRVDNVLSLVPSGSATAKSCWWESSINSLIAPIDDGQYDTTEYGSETFWKVLGVSGADVELTHDGTKETNSIKGWFQQFFVFMKTLGKQLITATGGTVGRSLEDRFADTMSIEDYGAVGDGVTDDTVAVQAALTAGGNILFGKNKTYNISAGLIARTHETHLDLNGSTLMWVGETVVPPIDFATMRDQKIMLYVGNSSSDGSFNMSGFSLRNGTINCNDYGVAMGIRGTERLKLENFEIIKSQGSAIDCQRVGQGAISNFRLTNCACNPAYAWTGGELEAYSDGINLWVGTQNVTISNGVLNNSRGLSSRAGIILEGYGVGGLLTEANTINNVYIAGYDRCIHSELAGHNTVNDCVLKVVNSESKRYIGAPVVSWAQEDKFVLNNCKIIADDFAMKLTSASDTHFNNCEISVIKGGFMQNNEAAYNNVVFNNCKLNFGQGATYFNNGSYQFNNCELLQDEWDANTDRCSFNLGIYKFHDCVINRVDLQSTTGGNTNEKLVLRGCEFKNYTNARTAVRIGNAGFPYSEIINCYTYQNKADVVFSIDDDTRIVDPRAYSDLTYTLTGTRNEWWFNGALQLSFAPNMGGPYAVGMVCWNTDPQSGEPVGWVCTAAGSPGTWSPFGTIA